MIKFWDVTFPGVTGVEKRKAYVYVPDSFKKNKKLRYPVLYMFDGHNVFFDTHATYGKSWGMKEYLEKTDTQLIVAAVECNHSPDHGRLKEYSPYDFYDDIYGTIRGKGYNTMKWYIETFKPYIDKHYPTLPEREFTFIGGSSMGGLMSLYALFRFNNVFSGAVSMSPSIWVDPKKIMKLVQDSDIDPLTDIYIDCGEHEVSSYYDKHSLFYNLIDTMYRRNICVTSRLIPDGYHCEASWERQLTFAIPSLMYRLSLYEEQAKAQFAKIKELEELEDTDDIEDPEYYTENENSIDLSTEEAS